MVGRIAHWNSALITIALWLAACSAPAHANPATVVIDLTDHVFTPTLTFTPSRRATFTPTASRTPAPSHTPTATPTPSATPTPPCRQPNGSLVADSAPSPTLGHDIKFRLYLPPCYDMREWAHYPTLYLLHGLGMNETTWDELGADDTANRLITGGEVSPFIIVMPRDSDDDFGAGLVNDLIPYVQANYRAIDDRAFRALGGMSRGGGWVAHIGFQQPELFGALGMHSLAIFYSDETKMGRWLDAIPPGQMPRLYLDIGRADSLLISAAWLDEALTRRGIDHHYVLNSGAHTSRYWTEQLPDYLRWYAANW